MSKKKQTAQHHEEHIDETWLIPYADLLTLLLALFIVLFASAQVDQKKFEEIAQSFTNAFKGNTSVFESTSAPPQVSPTKPSSQSSPSVISNAPTDKTNLSQQEKLQLAAIKSALDQYIKDRALGGNLETALVDEGLMIRIKDSALFTSGSAEILPEARAMSAEIAKILGAIQQNVIISGHTDNVPINTYEFPTNWDLSSKRALNFMKLILAQNSQLQPERFSAIGYGEYRPIASNQTSEGRSSNRRVDVMIVRKYQQ